MRKIITLLCILSIHQFLFAKESYIWPTNAPELLSATFGETRAGHFHSGIDIKTWAKIGYECYAIGNGYISRVKESPNGYGKVLYLKLDDGNTAVYSHLDRYNGKLETIIYTMKVNEKTHLVDKIFNPNELRVREGNLIAFTGGSGTQYPHLHFEIRDTADAPVNALTHGLSIIDERSPVPTKIAISPFGPNSEVNGGLEIGLYDLKLFRNNIYVHNDTIQANGQVRIDLSVYDQGRSNNKNSPY